MKLPPPKPTLTYTPFPYTTLVLSHQMRVRRRQQQRAAGLRLADRERDDGGDGAVDAHAGDGMKITHPSCRTCSGIQPSTSDTARGGLAPGTSPGRSEEHTSELQSLMRISYAVFCLKKKNKKQ